jgi:hypothetical protein
MRNGLMPRLSTMIRPPRRARMARPSREFKRLAASTKAAINSAQIR